MEKHAGHEQHLRRRIGAAVGAFLCLGMMSFAGGSFANPAGGSVASGSASISQTQNSTTIQQSSQQAIINWQSFNIQQGQQTSFIQPQNGITLNRINPSQGVSEIYGHLSSTGQIILINQAGIYFGPSAYVNVGGLIASTSNMSDQDFLAGNYNFNQASSTGGSIINDGHIATLDHGFVVLMGTGVVNNGKVEAQLGQVVLASGSEFTLSFQGNDLISFAVSAPTQQAGKDQNGNTLSNGVLNAGIVEANGGSIEMTTRAAQGVLTHAVNMEGVAEAKVISKDGDGGVNLNSNPVIDLDGGNGDVVVSGKVDASDSRVASSTQSGAVASPTGGTVTVEGGSVEVTPTGTMMANGGGGQIIILGGEDNGSVTVAGKLSATSQNGQGGQVTAVASNVHVTGSSQIDVSGGTGGGTVNLGGSGPGTSSLPTAETTIVDAGASIHADAYTNGNGGNINIISTQHTEAHGLVSANGGINGGNGGFIDTSGNYLDVNGMQISLTAPHGKMGTWLLDPQDVLIEDNGGNSGMVGDIYIYDISNLESDLAAGTVEISTTNDSFSAQGNITLAVLPLNAQLTWSAATSLLLMADSNIILQSAINASNVDSSIIMTANMSGDGGNIQLMSSGVKAGGVTLNGNVALSQASVLTATNHNVIINGGVSGGFNLTIAGAGPVNSISGPITGSGTALTQDGAGTLTIPNSGNTYTGGTFIDDGTLVDSSTSSTSLGTGSVNVNGGTLLLNNASLSNALNIQGAGTAGSAGAVVGATDTTDTINGPVTLTGDAIIGMQDSSTTLNFGTSGTIDGGYNLIFNGSNVFGAATLSGVVGGITPLTSLTMTADSLVQFNAAVNAGSVAIDSGSTLILSGVSLSSPLQIQGTGVLGFGALIADADTSNTLSGPVTLTGATTIGMFSGGSLTFASTATIDGPYDLSFTGQGNLVALNGAVGGSIPLASLTINDSGTTTLGADITTAGAQTYHNPMLVNSSILRLTAGTNVDFLSTVNSVTPDGTDLVVNGTQAEFNAAVGGVSAVQQLVVFADTIIMNGATTGSDGQLYQQQFGVSPTLSLNGNYLTSGGTFSVVDNVISLAGTTTIDTTSNNTVPTGANINLTAISNSGAHPLILNAGSQGNISGSTISGGGNLTIDNSNNTSFSGQVNAGTLDIANTVSSVAFNNALVATTFENFSQGYSLLIDGDGTTITNPVVFSNTGGVTLGTNGSSVSQTYNFLGGLTSTASTTVLAAGNSIGNTEVINTNNHALQLGVVQLTGVGTVDLSGGAGALSLGIVTGSGPGFNAASLLTNSSVGATLNGNIASIKTLTMGGGGMDVINATSIATVGEQLYNDSVQMGANTTFTGSILDFASTITTAGPTVGNATITASNAAVLGGAVTLSSLLLNGGNSTTDSINGGSVTTSGNQTYEDDTTLGSNTVLTSTAGTIDLASTGTIDGSFNGVSEFSLTISNTDAASTIAGILTGLAGTGFTKNGSGTLTMTGEDIASAPVTVNGGMLVAENSVLGSSLSGGSPVTVNAGATLEIAGTPVSSAAQPFTVGYAGQPLTLNGDGNGAGALTSICTVASECAKGESWNGNVTLGSSTVTISTSDALIFLGSFTGNGNNLVLSGTGAMGFDGPLSGINNFTDNAAAGVALDNGGFTTAGSQTYNSLLAIQQDTTLTTVSANITINQGVEGNPSGDPFFEPFNLSLVSNGPNTVFTVGGSAGSTPVGALDVENLTVTGFANGNDTLYVPTTDSQVWTISQNNGGSINGLAGVNPDGAGAGFTFSNIANVTGGASNASFIFSGPVALTGTVSGGANLTSTTKLLNYVSYNSGAPVTVTLTTPNAGLTQTANAQAINQFNEINDIEAAGNAAVYLPPQQGSVTYTNTAQALFNTGSALLTFNGFNAVAIPDGVIDPIIFNGSTHLILTNGTAIIGGQLIQFSNFKINAFFGDFVPVLLPEENEANNAVAIRAAQILYGVSQNALDDPLFQDDALFSADLSPMEAVRLNVDQIMNSEQRLDKAYERAAGQSIKVKQVMEKVSLGHNDGAANNVQ